ncbi:MAG: ABC transporter ATP-binding protein [Armatimonadota bacterium]|nr:ABC transporter ATP-binding protein [Armatimonadota bacterium]MDR7450613.1 ABC transporter ATP-binding protein [Armatimonadota bacterium]MDR7466254.1 ABC transporter ATP-binding protein [Armatimonadota bacterium]MDR7492975.1 ABC transporter ATP-binding protein [Armatimonadota bacterium]MDR7498268.1 ABC transporter ATP-binding protein [Armatimonadota bacterium]
MATGAQGAPCLVLESVTKDFGGLRAVDRVNLRVEQGQRRAIIGPNGAGKTTLFHLISGELPVSAGRILFFGRDITGLPSYRRTALGLGRTYQITTLFPRLSVLENVLLALLGTDGRKYDPRRPVHAHGDLVDDARRLLDTAGLWERRGETVRSLSHGEQRQIEVLLALAGRPKLLLLDEPTAGLSPAEARVLTRLVRGLDPRITVLLIEHDMDVAFEVAEVITVMHLGRVLAEGTPGTIQANADVQQIYLGAGL